MTSASTTFSFRKDLHYVSLEYLSPEKHEKNKVLETAHLRVTLRNLTPGLIEVLRILSSRGAPPINSAM